MESLRSSISKRMTTTNSGRIEMVLKLQPYTFPSHYSLLDPSLGSFDLRDITAPNVAQSSVLSLQFQEL